MGNSLMDRRDHKQRERLGEGVGSKGLVQEEGTVFYLIRVQYAKKTGPWKNVNESVLKSSGTC